jgi:broad specificity phosphatase PhoE
MIPLVFESHSTSTDNEKGIASGWLNPPLSLTGVQQAKELGLRYEHEDITIIYVSDSNRSFETAQIAFSSRKIPIVKDSRLREWNYGKFNGADAETVEKLKIDYLHTPFPEGESFQDVLKRFYSFKKECLEGKNIRVMIIGHRATYYALELSCNKASVETLVTAKWKWQPGRKYFVNETDSANAWCQA